MASSITSRARSYVRSRAINEMTFTCRIERVQRPGYDEENLIATPGSKTVIYEGVCRVWEVAGASAINVGETDVDIQSTQLSTPFDAPLAKKNDEVLILTSVHDPRMVGKRLQIQSSAKAGELRATRRYNVTMMQ